MNMRFSTVAANADNLDEQKAGSTGDPARAGEDSPQRSTAPKPRRYSRGGAGAQGKGKPGPDISAPGLVKDEDAGKS